MLPRLRFVVAALVLALLPWALFSTGAVMRSHDAAPDEMSRVRLTLLQQATMTGDEAKQLQAFAYARRSEELERLRVLASAPLPNWLAAPAGGAGDEPVADATPPPASADPSRGEAPPEPAREASIDATPAADAASTAEAENQSVPVADDASVQQPEEGVPSQPMHTAPQPAVAAALPWEEDVPGASTATIAESLPPETIPLPRARPLQRQKLSPAHRRDRLAARAPVRQGAPAPAAGSPDNPFAGLFNLP